MYRVVAVLTFSLAAGCAVSTLGPLAVRVQYRTTADPVEFPLLPACSAVSAVEASDTRRDTQLGTRHLEKTPDASYPVTSPTDIAAWARSGVEEALRRSRVDVGKSSAPILRIAVEDIVTGESVYRRAEYDGRVVLSAELRRSANEAPCWKERVEGVAENYGYAGNNENYQETLNHALDRAVIRALTSPGFKDAVCECAAKSGRY